MLLRMLSGGTRSAGNFSPDQIFQVPYLFAKQIQLSCEALNFRLGATIDVEIEFAAESVLRVLAILTHHDDRRLNCGQH